MGQCVIIIDLFSMELYTCDLYNKVFNPVNLVFLLLLIQSIRLTTFCHIFVKQLMTDFKNNYTEKAKILYFLNLIYFLSLVGLWQNHVLYWPLTDFMWRNRTPFGKRVVNKYGEKWKWNQVSEISANLRLTSASPSPASDMTR
jgi:hypothetical protein